MTLFEVKEIAERIGQIIDDAADITFGAVIDPSLQNAIRVTLIAARMEEMSTSARLQTVRPDTPRLQLPRAPLSGGARAMSRSMPAPHTSETPMGSRRMC